MPPFAIHVNVSCMLHDELMPLKFSFVDWSCSLMGDSFFFLFFFFLNFNV